MAKSLIVCCDGTWDKPDESHGAERTCTNVFKLWRGLAESAADGGRQLTFYHEGVGTGGRMDRMLGGVFGTGLAHNVCDCYRFLAMNYAPGDKIFLFGFSRGAFTARSTAGMVRNCGLLHPEEIGRIGEAFQLYRDRGDDTSPTSAKARDFKSRYALEPSVYFIGVWDTVGSLGIPTPIPLWRSWWAFHDSELSSTVKHAYHAIAVDEQRRPFKPTIWTRSATPEDQVLEQVWFAGCHRDIGGGDPTPDLADITLAWMVQRAVQAGLVVSPDYFQTVPGSQDAAARYEGTVIDPNPLGTLHPSLKGIWKAVPYRRAIPYGTTAGVTLTEQSVSSSAVTRGHEMKYDPPNLRAYLRADHVVTDVAPGRPADEVARPDTGLT